MRGTIEIAGNFPARLGPGAFAGSHDRRLRIQVVLTSIEGTVAALEAARELGHGLNAEITLIVAAAVSFRYELDCPPVPRAYFERLCETLLLETGVEANAVNILYCREPGNCLKAALGPQSLVLLGARRRWWPRQELRLERELTAQGHSVLLIREGSEAARDHSRAVVRRMVEAASEQVGR